MRSMGEKMSNFYKLTVNSPMAAYMPCPRFLMQNEFSCVSSDAKLLYFWLLDRASISKLNGYVEPDGTIRLYYTVDEAQKELHRGRQCVTRVFRELQNRGLICRRRQGLCKPAIITLNYPATAKMIPRKENDGRG